jgi:2-polyprenyl-3-methyl-5-hydroxy-6-metoxy-1,4-benzoquinol methylase
VSLNRAGYDAAAAQWDAARRDFYGRERDYLELFLGGLPAGARILDAGCGTGRPMAEHVAALGYAVTGVDQSAAMLELARRRLPGQTFRLAALEDCDFAGPYGGVICWDALFHIPRDRHRDILERLCRVLEPGGRIMLTSGGSAHPAFTDRMFGQEFFYDSLPPEALLALLRNLGFRVLLSELLNRPDGGRDKGRLAVVAQLPQ